jgi:hypothetical protein
LHAINKGKLLALRDALYWERGEVPPLEDNSVADLKDAKALGYRCLGSNVEVSYKC